MIDISISNNNDGWIQCAPLTPDIGYYVQRTVRPLLIVLVKLLVRALLRLTKSHDFAIGLQGTASPIKLFHLRDNGRHETDISMETKTQQHIIIYTERMAQVCDRGNFSVRRI